MNQMNPKYQILQKGNNLSNVMCVLGVAGTGKDSCLNLTTVDG